jgi:ABC-type amino acid transport substrate-binding protein
VTGLDIERVRAIAARAGQDLTFTGTTWPRLMQDVAAGRQGLASGVASMAERAAPGLP